MLYECLASTFQQTYPREKYSVYFCVSSRDDPAVIVINQLLTDFPQFDALLMIEQDNEYLESHPASLGPNPKIRNMSRAYREAKGDHIWIIDCNVWVAKGAAGRLVDTIEGWSKTGSLQKQKFVHQLPLVVDVSDVQQAEMNRQFHGNDILWPRSTSTAASAVASQAELPGSNALTPSTFGARLEELFLSSSHAKFYTAINTVLVAPCIVGKSNMFRRSHLDNITSDSSDSRPPGIDYFSHNICEDHLIGDLLWKHRVPEEVETGEKLGKHALVFGDLAIQPVAFMSIKEYVARRVRWLRVRKFTVLAATLIEPSTESFLCSFYGAYGMTSNPWVHELTGIPQTWLAFTVLWLLSVSLWACVDWSLYRILHSMGSVEADSNTPSFAQTHRRRSFIDWIVPWIGRETLALPIWLWAVVGGTIVTWRGNKYRVSYNLKVHAVPETKEE